jgi:protein-S-isoprenylcysteine O-methyltransferase Ste14
VRCSGSGWPRSADRGRPARRASGWHDALMAGAMIWMIFAMSATMPMAPVHGGMPAMSRPATPTAILLVSAVLAAYFGLAAIPWLVRAIGPRLRLRDRAVAGHAAMSTGMAALLLAML